MNRSPITTHVLDTAAGRPAAGIRVDLFRRDGESLIAVGSGVTDADGRIAEGLIDVAAFRPGTYRIVFATGEYLGKDAFYPTVTIDFAVAENEPHYHVPVLLSPFGYSTYRGS